jgi:hypothetical protein
VLAASIIGVIITLVMEAARVIFLFLLAIVYLSVQFSVFLVDLF